MYLCLFVLTQILTTLQCDNIANGQQFLHNLYNF